MCVYVVKLGGRFTSVKSHAVYTIQHIILKKMCFSPFKIFRYTNEKFLENII